MASQQLLPDDFERDVVSGDDDDDDLGFRAPQHSCYMAPMCRVGSRQVAPDLRPCLPDDSERDVVSGRVRSGTGRVRLRQTSDRAYLMTLSVSRVRSQTLLT